MIRSYTDLNGFMQIYTDFDKSSYINTLGA